VYYRKPYLFLPSKYFKYKQYIPYLKIFLDNEENKLELQDVALKRISGKKAVKLPLQFQKLLDNQKKKYFIIEVFV